MIRKDDRTRCGCRRGVQRDNCPACEGTGWRIDFAAIRRDTCVRLGHAFGEQRTQPTCLRCGARRDDA
jgi:hypothetical protein